MCVDWVKGMDEHIVEIEKNVHLERLLTGDKEMQKKMQQAVKKAVQQARNRLSKEARTGLRMRGDERQAYRAIKSAVWRRSLGGSVSILAKRKASSKSYVSNKAPDRTGKRGGNRMPRGKRTEQLMSYYGSDRGFILRFLNAGTVSRTDEKRRGYRGSIPARNWFGNASQQQLMRASEEIERIIDQAIAEVNV